MRVLFFYHRDDGSYGAAKSMNRLVQLLKEEHNVHPIIVTPYKNFNNENADKNGIENYVIPYQHSVIYKDKSRMKNMYYRIRQSVDTFFLPIRLKKIDFTNIDIIHSSSSVIDVGAKVAKTKSIPHIWHIRELHRNWIYPNEQHYFGFMNRNTDKFIAISNIVKDRWQSFGIDQNKIVTVYNGLPLETSPKYNWPDTKTLSLVFSGYLSDAKGQLEFLQSINLLSKEIKENIVIDFYGDGEKEYLKALKDYSEKCLPSVKVNFKGYLSNLTSILNQYDLGIINSKEEAFGRTTIEYMLSGIAVLASNAGANPELMIDGEMGFLFDMNDPEDLSNKITHIFNNRYLLKIWGENARKHASKNFSDYSNAERIYEEYKKIIHSKLVK